MATRPRAEVPRAGAGAGESDGDQRAAPSPAAPRARRPAAPPTDASPAARITKFALRLSRFVHAGVALLFAAAALLLIAIATRMAWDAAVTALDVSAAQQIIEAIGYLAAAVVALQIAQTVAEEEVIRDAHISAPTRVRRFLSRFLVVIVVALAIEGLVATFDALHTDPSHLPYAASVIVAVAFLLAGWGVFLRFNREAEELEPEAMDQAKDEDAKLR